MPFFSVSTRVIPAGSVTHAPAVSAVWEHENLHAAVKGPLGCNSNSLRLVPIAAFHLEALQQQQQKTSWGFCHSNCWSMKSLSRPLSGQYLSPSWHRVCKNFSWAPPAFLESVLDEPMKHPQETVSPAIVWCWVTLLVQGCKITEVYQSWFLDTLHKHNRPLSKMPKTRSQITETAKSLVWGVQRTNKELVQICWMPHQYVQLPCSFEP